MLLDALPHKEWENRVLRFEDNQTMPKRRARRFSWPWPHSMAFKTLSPVRGWEYTAAPGHRAFYLEHDENFDEIPWGGLALLFRDGAIRADMMPAMIAAILLYRARRGLQEYREPVKGIRGLYRDRSGGSVAQSLMGDKKKALNDLRQGLKDGERLEPKAFRRRLSQIFRTNTSVKRSARMDGLPIGVASHFKLPTWDTTCDAAAARVLQDLGDHISKWQSGKGRRRPKDPLKYLKDRFSHSSQPPLNATREELACTVAFATWIAQSCCYPYAMWTQSKNIDPPLNKTEKLLFIWYHSDKSLLGIPLQCVRPDYWNLTQSVATEFLRKKITAGAAQQKMAQILGYHSLLKEDSQYQDRDRKAKMPKRIK